ncbi:deoxyribodipyrimidine photo-lyase [Ahrensia sp. R2A130]|uniref:cryptochrome/photolyase family protein n=1 Tax=Ahrensia sp. R2A130 TaxID=744979 RepID=UPI0001E093F2|nr:deoxyribodipyrimidine photo-lyase [Ahrensia sp. R2A130]EFL89969.1 cryptochrome-2 [Ahrensia sp. R2A130]
MSKTSPIIMWFRQDLRLDDNPALIAAAESGKPVVAVFVFDEASEGIRKLGGAMRWWLHHSLKSLTKDLGALGVDLILRRGPGAEVIFDLAKEVGAENVVWNRRYGDAEQTVDATIKGDFEGEAKSYGGIIMHEPINVRTGTGNPYKVYTPFWKKFCEMGLPRDAHPAPQEIAGFGGDVASDNLDEWDLLPTKPDWSDGWLKVWTPGESAAQTRARAFMSDDLDVYDSARDLPGDDRTSRLSPHLRWGEISPYRLWQMAQDGRLSAGSKARETWVKELVWREFSYHLLQEWPDLANENFNTKYDSFPWRSDDEQLRAWQKGQTGYPIVDAGMRQLWQTGWMHNRVRMIVGSFLVKHLLLDWRHGEDWFWDTLVDGDPASNSAQWQWVAGTGADAAPFFRIFNPIMQAEKFDKDGVYIKKWVPELAKLPAKYLPSPWEAPLTVLRDAGVKLGDTYPRPIVDHKEARERALAALQEMREAVDG